MICKITSVLLALAGAATLLSSSVSAGHVVSVVDGTILFTSNGTIAARDLSSASDPNALRRLATERYDLIAARHNSGPSQPKASSSPSDFCCPPKDLAPNIKYEPDTFFNTVDTSFPRCGYAPKATDATETWCYYDEAGHLQRDVDDGWCPSRANTCVVEQIKKREAAAEVLARARPAGKMDRSVEPEELSQMRAVWKKKSRLPSAQ